MTINLFKNFKIFCSAKKTVTEMKHWANRGKGLQMVTCLIKACVVCMFVYIYAQYAYIYILLTDDL